MCGRYDPVGGCLPTWAQGQTLCSVPSTIEGRGKERAGGERRRQRREEKEKMQKKEMGKER